MITSRRTKAGILFFLNLYLNTLKTQGLGVWTQFARALRSVLLTWISARTRLWEKQTWNLYIDHFILFNEDFASVFSVLTIKQFVMCQKRLFFNVLRVILLENTLPIWDCLYGSRKIPVKCSARAVNQKIVTARFSGNALISTEPLARISWNLVE